MNWNEIKGMELEDETGGKYFVAAIDERGITIKGLITNKEAACVNVNYSCIYKGSFEDHFISMLNYIYAGVMPNTRDFLEEYGYRDGIAARAHMFGICQGTPCAHQ